MHLWNHIHVVGQGKKEQISDTETELEERLSVFERYIQLTIVYFK